MSGRCPKCRKEIRTEAKARKLALTLRTGVVRMSRVQRGFNRTHAYACPHGNGWHIGRAKRKDWPPRLPNPGTNDSMSDSKGAP